MKHGFPMLATALVLLTASCSSLTETDEMEEFVWTPRINPESVVDTVETSSALRVLHIVGRLRTPSHCDDLEGDYGRSGKQLTLRVRATPGPGTNCDSGPGGFQYHAVVDGLGRQTYQLRVIHDVYGGQRKEFNLVVAVID